MKNVPFSAVDARYEMT